MGEGQSRYGIMEQLSQKKLEANKRLSELEQRKDQQTRVYEDKIFGIKKQLDAENSNYVDAYKVFVERLRNDIKTLEREHANRIAEIEHRMEIADQNYELEHQTRVQLFNLNIVNEEQGWKRQLSKFSLDEKAIKSEIKELEDSIKNLKEMSKEQAKSPE